MRCRQNVRAVPFKTVGDRVTLESPDSPIVAMRAYVAKLSRNAADGVCRPCPVERLDQLGGDEVAVAVASRRGGPGPLAGGSCPSPADNDRLHHLRRACRARCGMT